MRKQAMDGLSGAFLRRLRSCGLVPLQEEALFSGGFFCCFGRESYLHPLGSGSFAIDVASPLCGKNHRNRDLAVAARAAPTLAIRHRFDE
ncbi:hypothetical protein [Lysobacter sp. 1R34A]|uniref:hypothetical protein n=1 Tax=Lysobacter sp. 1R34A TaxID=3445786 RepID=UPI003EE92115